MEEVGLDTHRHELHSIRSFTRCSSMWHGSCAHPLFWPTVVEQRTPIGYGGLIWTNEMQESKSCALPLGYSASLRLSKKQINTRTNLVKLRRFSFVPFNTPNSAEAHWSDGNWSEERASNSHALRRGGLNPTRLPIPLSPVMAGKFPTFGWASRMPYGTYIFYVWLIFFVQRPNPNSF